MTHTFRTAELGGFEGEGWLEPAGADDTDTLEGRWRPLDGEDATIQLREAYMARAALPYRSNAGESHEVYIASWFGMGHADALVIRSASDLR